MLTEREKRVVSVVVAARGRLGDEEHKMQRKAEALFLEREGALREAASRFDARIEVLAGVVVATLYGRGSATDQAARAARLGLSFRSFLPGIPMALATGRAEIGERAMGDVIDRAVRRVSSDPEDETQVVSEDGASVARPRAEAPPARGDTVWLDEVTAGLLGPEFSVEVGASGLELTGERPARDAQVRTLARRADALCGTRSRAPASTRCSRRAKATRWRARSSSRRRPASASRAFATSGCDRVASRRPDGRDVELRAPIR